MNYSVGFFIQLKDKKVKFTGLPNASNKVTWIVENII
jgi:hypothetical protein